MNKTSHSTAFKNQNATEDWNFQLAIEWLSTHKRIVLWFFLSLLAVLIFAYRMISIQTSKAEKDYFEAENLFTQFQKASTSSSDSLALDDLKQLNLLMQQHPELKPKYEGSLAQTLLIIDQPEEAQKFADNIFKRTQHDDLQFYQNYSQASLLISEGQYVKALDETKQLKTALDQQEEKSHPLLYIFNLIRLAMLYQQMGNEQEELNTWNELQNQPTRLEAFLAVNKTLKIGQASLNQYIEERKKNLIP